MNLQDASNLGSVISSLSAALIVLITFSANKKLQEITSYSNLQEDRKIIERIFSKREEAYTYLMQGPTFENIEVLKILGQSKSLAKLYGLEEIYRDLEYLSKLCMRGYGLRFRIWDQSGFPLPNYEQAEMNEYHQLVTDSIKQFDMHDLYQKSLKIKIN